MKRDTVAIFCLAIYITVSLIIGLTFTKHDHTIIEQRDTTTVHDTVTFAAPQATESKRMDSFKVRLPKAPQTAYLSDSAPSKQMAKDLIYNDTTDSVDVIIPDTQKIFRDSLYTIWASGYNIRLDSIRLYPTTNYITHTITKTEYTKRKKFSLGVGIGYGYNGTQFTPHIGIHVGYKILEW